VSHKKFIFLALLLYARNAVCANHKTTFTLLSLGVGTLGQTSLQNKSWQQKFNSTPQIPCAANFVIAHQISQLKGNNNAQWHSKPGLFFFN